MNLFTPLGVNELNNCPLLLGSCRYELQVSIKSADCISHSTVALVVNDAMVVVYKAIHISTVPVDSVGRFLR